MSSRDIQQDLNDDLLDRTIRLASPRLVLLLSHCSSTEIVGWLIVERPSSRGCTVNWTTAAPRAYSPHAARSTKSRLPQLRRAGDNCRGTGSSLGSIYSVRSRPELSIHARCSVSSRRSRLQMPSVRECVRACARHTYLRAYTRERAVASTRANLELRIASRSETLRECVDSLFTGPAIIRIFNLLSTTAYRDIIIT